MLDREYDYDALQAECAARFGYDLRATLRVVDEYRQSLRGFLRAAKRAADMDTLMELLVNACAEAGATVGLLTAEVELFVGSKVAAEWRAFAASERRLWELYNRREHHLSARREMWPRAAAAMEKQRELQLALRALEAFPALTDAGAGATVDDDLSALLGAASLSAGECDPADELCALLAAADFSSSSHDPSDSESEVPKPAAAWEAFLASSPLAADADADAKIGWLVAPPPHVVRPGESARGGRFAKWTVDAVQPVRFECDSGESDCSSNCNYGSRRPPKRAYCGSEQWDLSSRSPSPAVPSTPREYDVQGGRRGPARRERYGPYQRKSARRGMEAQRRCDRDAVPV